MTGRYRDVDVTHTVARAVRSTVEAARPDGLLVAEHFHDSAGDLAGDCWHAAMNYSGFARPVWGWLTPTDTDASAHGLPAPGTRPQTLHGPDLTVRDGGLHLPGGGPGVGVWRLV